MRLPSYLYCNIPKGETKMCTKITSKRAAPDAVFETYTNVLLFSTMVFVNAALKPCVVLQKITMIIQLLLRKASNGHSSSLTARIVMIY